MGALSKRDSTNSDIEWSDIVLIYKRQIFFFVFADVVHASISDSLDLSESFAKVSTKKKTNEDEKDGIHSGTIKNITHPSINILNFVVDFWILGK